MFIDVDQWTSNKEKWWVILGMQKNVEK